MPHPPGISPPPSSLISPPSLKMRPRLKPQRCPTPRVSFLSTSRVDFRVISNSPRQIRPIPLRPPRLQQRRHKRQREPRHQVRCHEGGFEAVAGVAREALKVTGQITIELQLVNLLSITTHAMMTTRGGITTCSYQTQPKPCTLPI